MHSILIVDDSVVSGLLLKHLLNRVAGVRAESFQDPLDALARSATQPPSLVVADYKMPQLDGLTFMEALRLMPGCGDVPLVMVTGEPGVRERALYCGASAVLGKPVEPAFIQETIIRLLGLDSAPLVGDHPGRSPLPPRHLSGGAAS